MRFDIHLALIIILLGACVTHFFGEQGEVHLRADKAERVGDITLFLWDFQILYDEENNPKDFVSELRLLDRSRASKSSTQTIDEGIVRMNKPLKYHGWRFCQSDYDSDGMGVILSYNHDPWGIGITYTGYALLLVGMVVFFFRKNTYFRSIFRKQDSWLMVGLGVAAVLLAVVMTKVVTPKPPLQPVLQTPLLGIHVSVIMLSYTLFAVIMVNGILGLVMRSKSTQIATLSQVLLYPAVFCLSIGIFVGAVWANISWGRYWGWDPKETWALITMIVYAALLHWPVFMRRSTLRPESKEKIYHILCVVDFLFVLFTYFGVNHLLGGLHSYA